MPGAGCRKPRNTVTSREILEHLADGWRLYIGSGVYSNICRLERDGQQKNLWRQRVAALRDAGLISYVIRNGAVTYAVITAKGLRAKEAQLTVQTARGPREDRS